MANLKEAAAARAVEEVKSGMVLGLGTGSTAAFAVAQIGALWQQGRLERIIGIPTSEKTANQARSLGMPLGTLQEYPRVDLAIDGADEVDPRLNLIKGLGGALLRERQVERVADRFIVIVDDSKLVDTLGTRSPLPVEVDKTTWKDQLLWLKGLGCTPILRELDHPFVTDNGNYIIDCHFESGIVEPTELAKKLESQAGVQGHGLFLEMATEVVVAGESGVRLLKR